MLKRYRYQVEHQYDAPEFRKELQRIAQDNSQIESSLKEDIGATVWRSEFEGRRIVIKRYNTQGIWHAIRRSFRQSRADNCRKMAIEFTRAGIFAAPNVAVIQEWLGPFKLRSWFLCEYIPGELLHDYLSEQAVNQISATELITLKTNIIELFESFRSHHLSHGDLKASNILLLKDRLCVIDLDAARAHKNKALFRRAHIKDQSRFMKNWLRQPKIHQTLAPLINQQHPGPDI
ncbi:MAG: protein kinase [Proteobacteria bacterium]|nr:protein kinase [Pseudomonadota bacterium]